MVRLRSAPAQNALVPAPVTRATRISGSDPTRRHACCKSWRISASIALSASGRFKVISATPSDTDISTGTFSPSSDHTDYRDGGNRRFSRGVSRHCRLAAVLLVPELHGWRACAAVTPAQREPGPATTESDRVGPAPLSWHWPHFPALGGPGSRTPHPSAEGTIERTGRELAPTGTRRRAARTRPTAPARSRRCRS